MSARARLTAASLVGASGLAVLVVAFVIHGIDLPWWSYLTVLATLAAAESGTRAHAEWSWVHSAGR